MNGSGPERWLDRLVGICFAILIAAAALYFAVKLVEAVVVPLVIIGSLLFSLAITVAILRARNRDW